MTFVETILAVAGGVVLGYLFTVKWGITKNLLSGLLGLTSHLFVVLMIFIALLFACFHILEAEPGDSRRVADFFRDNPVHFFLTAFVASSGAYFAVRSNFKPKDSLSISVLLLFSVLIGVMTVGLYIATGVWWFFDLTLDKSVFVSTWIGLCTLAILYAVPAFIQYDIHQTELLVDVWTRSAENLLIQIREYREDQSNYPIDSKDWLILEERIRGLSKQHLEAVEAIKRL